MKQIVRFLTGLVSNSIEEGSLMEFQQRQVFSLSLVLLYLCVPVYALTVPLPNANYFYLNGGLLTFTSLVAVGYFIKRIKLNTAFSIILLAIQAETAAEMIYCATLNDYSFQRMLIMSNIKFSVLFIMLPVCAYMYRGSVMLSAITISAYAACVLILGGSFFRSYLPLILLIFVLMPILGRLLHQNFRKLENKHELLKSEEAQLLKSLQVSKDELYTFAKLVNDSSKGTINNDLLNVLGEKTKKNLYEAAAAFFMEEKCKADVIKDYFPELTPTELVIVALILQDKTVGEICEILHRSSGNITSHRSNIRTKLGLSKTDNLKAALRLRVRIHEFPDCGN